MDEDTLPSTPPPQDAKRPWFKPTLKVIDLDSETLGGTTTGSTEAMTAPNSLYVAS